MDTLHLEYSEDRKIWFTSDLHVGHRNVIRFCSRPFADIKEMSTALISNWNSVVGENDIVFDLGDMFWWDSRHDTRKFVDKLNGTIYKIAGNHDKDPGKLFSLCDPGKVTVLSDTVTVFVTGFWPDQPKKAIELWLNHFPLATWPHWNHGSIQLFGHIHSGPTSGSELDIPGKDLILKEGQYDVGVDNNNYKPVELKEIVEKLLKSQESSLSLV